MAKTYTADEFGRITAGRKERPESRSHRKNSREPKAESASYVTAAVKEAAYSAPEHNDTEGGRTPARSQVLEDRRSARKSKLQRTLYSQVTAVLAAVVTLGASVGRDYLAEDVFSDESGGTEICTELLGAAEAFPDLDNLMPDTAVGEAYLYLSAENDSVPLYSAGQDDLPLSLYPGASYDKASNTLYLCDVNCSSIDINLMGNGLRLHLSGDSTVGCIRCYGYHYGGSLTLCGNGSLRVNPEKSYAVGITLDCEMSCSALIIEDTAQVDIYGSESAVAVLASDSTLGRGIFWKSTSETEVYCGSLKLSYESLAGTDYGNSTYQDSALYNADGTLAAEAHFARYTGEGGFGSEPEFLWETVDSFSALPESQPSDRAEIHYTDAEGDTCLLYRSREDYAAHWYDSTTNTLTLNNFSASYLYIGEMGSDFTILLKGESHIGQLYCFAGSSNGSITFTGSGSLTLGEFEGKLYPWGLLLNANYTRSVLRVETGVTLTLKGSDCAYRVYNTKYWRSFEILTGSTVTPTAYGSLVPADASGKYWNIFPKGEDWEDLKEMRIQGQE